ncbi:4'-phosphopantetheinyl transferase [Micromonospora sp. NPDC051925]|uniref:4'-phosphopantetheinyl transferase n=1 Tax=Micromonospora sp. NPDC051925 TaxID=3364288 RepID=UPI0037C61F3A
MTTRATSPDHSLIGRILPPQVCHAEAYHDVPESTLFPEEQALLLRAGPKRRREFTTVRACARQALAQLGVAPAPILPGPGRAPAWPAGVVGSMTHCAGYRAAAVASRNLLLSLGIDAEPALPLPRGVLGMVASAAETAHLAALAEDDPAVPWDRLLFCAKEAVYKAWFPVTGRWLGFADADVRIRPDGTLTAGLVTPTPTMPARLDGCWLASYGLLLATVTVPV